MGQLSRECAVTLTDAAQITEVRSVEAEQRVVPQEALAAIADLAERLVVGAIEIRG